MSKPAPIARQLQGNRPLCAPTPLTRREPTGVMGANPPARGSLPGAAGEAR